MKKNFVLFSMVLVTFSFAVDLTAQDWNIPIHATCESTADDVLSYLGVHSAATNGFDAAYDIPEPPPPGSDWVRLYFPHPEWGLMFDEFNSDIKAPVQDASTKVWAFDVDINHSTTVGLTWPDLSQVPSDYILLLIPGSKSDTVNMRDSSRYSFPVPSAPAIYSFEVSIKNPGPPQCVVDPTSLDYETVMVGDSSDLTFIISNIGGDTLSGTVSETCDDYTLVGDVTYSLTGSESKTFTVRFKPASTGVKNCTIETANGACADIGSFGVGCMEGVEVTAGGDESGYADSILSVAFLIQNVGVVPDSYSVDISDTQGWNIVPLHYDVALDTAEIEPVSFTVRIPYVPLGTVDQLSLLAVSRTSPLARDSASLNITCNAYVEDWNLTPGNDVSGSSNSRVTAVLCVQNPGLAPDSCHLTVSDSLSWDIQPEECTVTLSAGELDSVFFDIQIPGVSVGTTNKVTLAGVSLTNPYVADTASFLVTCESHNVTITEISDIGNDQGKQLRIRWSSFPGSDSLVTHFTIFRRVDPLVFASFGFLPEVFYSKDYLPGDWEMIDSYPAYGETLYSATVPTLKDSTISEGMYWSVFFIRAGTDNPTVYFDSPVDSGYSLDNLSPSPPVGLFTTHEPAITRLTWGMTSALDFDYYTIYRDTAGGFTPDSSNRLGFTIDTTLVDSTAELGRTYYYLTSATDFSGNESDPSNEATGIRYVTGDFDTDGAVKPNDVVLLLNYLFRNGAAPQPLEAGDFNCDGMVSPPDVVVMLNYLFRDGPPPSC